MIKQEIMGDVVFKEACVLGAGISGLAMARWLKVGG